MTEILQAKEMVDNAYKIVILTGAGISTDSGIPDFRGPDGVWTKDPEAEKLSTIEHFVKSPEMRRKSWAKWTDGPMINAEPNAGHHAINNLDYKLHLLVTQNVDGLHHKAGTDPEKIVEIHGTVREVNCVSHCGFRIPLGEVMTGELCPECGSYIKPAVVYFGEDLDLRDSLRAEAAAFDCDLFIAIGTSLKVWPIAGMFDIARQAGKKTMIINRDDTLFDMYAHCVVNDSISEVLPRIFT